MAYAVSTASMCSRKSGVQLWSISSPDSFMRSKSTRQMFSRSCASHLAHGLRALQKHAG